MKKIKKILIYSRHGLRYPLFKKDEFIDFFKKDVINWNFKDGILTSKGEILEYQFGKFLNRYIESFNFKVESKEYISNSLQRTILTAKLLALSMFPFDDIKIKYKYDDLISYEDEYNISIKEEDIDNKKIEISDNEIKDKYEKLEEILNIEKGKFFSIKSSAKLTKEGHLISDGRFKIATDVVDSYILKYYDGFNLEDIFKSENIKKDIMELSIIKDRLLDLLFADKKYIEKSKKNPYKLMLEHLHNNKDLTVIVGHDSNIATILSKLDLNIDGIGNEFEKYPIGAKLFFKVYEDNTVDIDYLMYDVDQIRNLEYENPKIKTLAKNLTIKS